MFQQKKKVILLHLYPPDLYFTEKHSKRSIQITWFLVEKPRK